VALLHRSSIWAALVEGPRWSAASAAAFLCAFGDAPRWTWDRVQADRGETLRLWMEQPPQAAMFPHGDHRPREPLTPDRIIVAVRSFIHFARKVNGPENVIKAPAPSSPAHHFALHRISCGRAHLDQVAGPGDLDQTRFAATDHVRPSDG